MRCAEPNLQQRYADRPTGYAANVYFITYGINMLTTIEQELKLIESRHGVKIIYACESGSRAWGFASNDSDYDIRFIYVRPIKDYFQVVREHDTYINRNNDERLKNLEKTDDLDFVGHDIQKALYLISKGNPDVISWLFSPIVYYSFETLEKKIKEQAFYFFKSKAGIYHYNHMARRNFNQYIDTEEPSMKKYLYVVRPVLACMWILDRSSPPPVDFSELYMNMKGLLSKEVIKEIDHLLKEKKKGLEKSTIKKLPALDKFLGEQIKIFDEIGEFPTYPKMYGQLNDLLWLTATTINA